MPSEQRLPTARSRRSRAVVIVGYPQCQALDITGPYEVFKSKSLESADDACGSPYHVVLASPLGGEIVTMSGLVFAGAVALQDLEGSADTVLVAGGGAKAIAEALAGTDLVPWLVEMAGSVRRIGGICTGAFLLAEAGLLNGRRATTHWESCDRLARTYPAIKVEPDAIFVSDPPFYTSAGVSAAIDLSLALIEADQGQPAALAVARELVLFLRRPGGQSQFSAGLNAQAEASNRLRDLIMWMVEHPEADFSVPALADRANMSDRHFARVFRKETGGTPARFADAVRIDRAKALLEAADWTLSRVAERSGFGSVDALHRSMRRQLGITPQQYRQRFARCTELPR
jgi:transcriptional regulator GlxA family with amidase domain